MKKELPQAVLEIEKMMAEIAVTNDTPSPAAVHLERHGHEFEMQTRKTVTMITSE